MRIAVISIALTLLTTTLSAQTSSVAPVNWERYKIPSKEISVLLPKLPTKLAGYDQCREEERVTYRAYAEGAAYELTISSSRKASPRPTWCHVPRNKFDRDALDKRLDEIEKQPKFEGRTETKFGALQAFRFSGATATRVLVSDIDANERWIELEVVHHIDKVPDLERFLGSVQLGALTGIDIGEGSEVTLGDEGTPAVPAVVADPAKPSTMTHEGSGPGDSAKGSRVGSGSGPGSGSVGGGVAANSAPAGHSSRYLMVAKERPGYTEAARQNKVQGTVSLKVTLLASGSVGSIVPIRRLPDGLTENAIYVARRLVFLPKRVNDTPMSVSVTIEYSFSIY